MKDKEKFTLCIGSGRGHFSLSMKIDMKRLKIIWCVLGISSSLIGK